VSSELYETLALAARYLFAFLAVVIVLRVYLSLLSNLSERKKKLRALPDAEYIGELVVISGNADLPEGTAIPVPWEGILGSIRSCDIFVPDSEVKRHHLSFSFDPSRGIIVHPSGGSRVLINNVPVSSSISDQTVSMIHGSYLQTGPILFRLRMFADLDPNAGFHQSDAATPIHVSPIHDASCSSAPDQYIPTPQASIDDFCVDQPLNQMKFRKISDNTQSPLPADAFMDTEGTISSSVPERDADHPAASGISSRQRRSERWEADWSE